MTKKKSLESALQEVKGIMQPTTTNDASINKIKLQRKKQPSAEEFVKHILAGDISFLSRAITLVESTNPKHKIKATLILEQCLPYANKSIRIGITGVPGVGKSTFIETFGKYFTEKGKKVAVLAIDPSSSINKGSILGDKTRMEELVKDKNAYIRPSPSGDSLGGVAQKTRETIILCEAAGFDTIFIETVGVGQSETAVHSMVDFFLLLKLAGAGDELQGIKRGIIEMADAIVINKADNENVKNAKLAKLEFSKALHLYPLKENGWQPKVTTCSAFYNEGIDVVFNIIQDYLTLTKTNGFFDEKRNNQNKYWLLETINQQLKFNFYSKKEVKESLKKYVMDIKNLKTTPFKAAVEILKLSNK
ncbi:MAG: methylmalonyl Co-A mutase-associated GTPase MeaB [Lutibacter sp.]|uniref:methylmalonyl Co-A mutase-associated GTPase MeaB n=1 Tax=Lutibacter sp. TaxID=1925666 RepID=UPI001806086E|nr:methylmalonyl Co-A mutase-associated GTPase MeaB [Lutibacter sp.]MBT8316979.1 methylmalonyl Co-A mutase-associated GTPase MeaB [Lutibacter sp.]NNJ57839.1 methylmalonyl Co-A mutase-associated GTPase MeaB [Lutibacter sp.]